MSAAVELSRVEEGTEQTHLTAGQESSTSTEPNKSTQNSSLSIALKIFGGITITVAGFLVVYYLGFRGDSNTESSVVSLDDSNTNLDALNSYYAQLKADHSASPTEHATYSSMGPEGSATFDGFEPADLMEKLLEKYPFLSDLKTDRYIVSGDILEQDDDAQWGVLRANVRGHANLTVLLSPDQLEKVQSAVASVSQGDTTVAKSSSVKAASSFNWPEATSSLHHAETTYCEEDTYLSRTFGGPLTGFVATYHITNPRLDTAGYIGYHTGEQTIYVTFRGTKSLNNWLTTNLDVDSVPYSRCSGCRVHSGFLEAAQAVFPQVLGEVQRLRALYPSYQVVVTGHSLGGALSHTTALELEATMNNVELYTFGCPRVGNDEFATYSTSKFPTASRVTHDKDMVVHTPGSIFYTHMAGEWHQPDDDVEVVECFGYEDENCSYQYVFTSIDDHMEYLGLEMGEGGCPAVTYD